MGGVHIRMALARKLWPARSFWGWSGWPGVAQYTYGVVEKLLFESRYSYKCGSPDMLLAHAACFFIER